MYFLLDACQNPSVLRVLYFGILFKNIFFVVAPIGLVLMIILDFSKAVIAGKEEEQKKSVQLIPKRIMYAMLIFIIPWVISILMNTVENLGLDIGGDYNQCIKNAKSGNFEYYEHLQEIEDKVAADDKLNKAVSEVIDTFNDGFTTIKSNVTNLMQGDYANNKVCGGTQKNGKPKTIASSGCGYMSFTMVAQSLGYPNVTPPQIVDIACNEFGYKGGPASYAFLTSSVLLNKFNFKVDTIALAGSKDPDKGKKYIPAVKQALKDGKKLIVLIPGHYISIIGINSDNTIIVRDSSRGFASDNKYTVESLYEATKTSGRDDCKAENKCGWTMILAYSRKEG